MKGKHTFTNQEARALVELINNKLIADTGKQKVIRNKIRMLGFYASEFGLKRGFDENDFLRVVTISSDASSDILPDLETENIKKPGRCNSDENYVINLCDLLLGMLSLRQHCFSFLSGDTGKALPVDAYYPSTKLVIEYHELQHTNFVTFWDKRETVSGVSRAEQRRLYDNRRNTVLSQNGIRLLVVNYHELAHRAGSKKLLRDIDSDKVVMAAKLKLL